MNVINRDDVLFSYSRILFYKKLLISKSPIPFTQFPPAKNGPIVFC